MPIKFLHCNAQIPISNKFKPVAPSKFKTFSTNKTRRTGNVFIIHWKSKCDRDIKTTTVGTVRSKVPKLLPKSKLWVACSSKCIRKLAVSVTMLKTFQCAACLVQKIHALSAIHRWNVCHLVLFDELSWSYWNCVLYSYRIDTLMFKIDVLLLTESFAIYFLVLLQLSNGFKFWLQSLCLIQTSWRPCN